MNLVQQILSANAPAKPYIPEVAKPVRKHFNHNTTNANEAKKTRAIAKYKYAAGGDWVRTIVLESRLGLSRSTAYPLLAKWLDQNIVERRPVGGKPFNRRVGWEWKFTVSPEPTEPTERPCYCLPE